MVAVDAESLLAEFVDSFNNLDLERFLDLWTDDATVFHPMPQMARRLSGIDEVRSGWGRVFDLIRERAPGPPYMDLLPADVELTELDENAQLVSFHLETPGPLARRSMVLVRRGMEGWKIAHLHASNLAVS